MKPADLPPPAPPAVSRSADVNLVITRVWLMGANDHRVTFMLDGAMHSEPIESRFGQHLLSLIPEREQLEL
jgi:hypothetical protein